MQSTNNEILEIEKQLNSKTKNELITLIMSMIEDELLSAENLLKYLIPKNLNEFEIHILEKLKIGKQSLTEAEIEFVQVCLAKKQNVKISSILSSTKKFEASVVKYKLNKCFNILWKLYPKKVGKSVGEKAFNKYISQFKYGMLNEVIKNLSYQVHKYAKWCEQNGTEYQFILMFSTYFNQKRFLDN